MVIKLSDYIANFLVEHQITQLFSVVGGGAMHMNDSFGHKKGLQVTYTHHEQAAAIAAESYARVLNKPAAVCVTSGPGATNAITGCLCSYMGSIPMLIFSGQVRLPHTVRRSGLHLRTLGYQEYDIVDSIARMTKYSDMLMDPQNIRYSLEKAYYLATTGRPGPVWLDIPLDIQSALIETETLKSYQPTDYDQTIPPAVTDELVETILRKIDQAKRPVLYAGLGIRLSGAYEAFMTLVDTLHIPVVTGMSTVDYIPNTHPLYAGRAGQTGDRAGNFAVQNSDLFLSIGSRLSFHQTGFDTATWARAAYKIMVDIDQEELKKDYLQLDLPVWADANDLIKKMNALAGTTPNNKHAAWIDQCRKWVATYPVVTSKHGQTPDGKANIYTFYDVLSTIMEENAVFVTTSGNSRVVGRQAFIIKKGQRFITNHAASPMGYCLPASIGACIANNRQKVVLVTGDGGIQMNLQELQTIKQNQLPIKIVVINNEGYHSIRMTQKAFFKEHSHVGIGADSGDLSFPDLSKLAPAYNIDYYSCDNNHDLRQVLENFLAGDNSALCQIFVTKYQQTEPKSSSKKLDDGSMVSAPLEDLSPFLPREELQSNMYIPLVP